MWTIQSLSRGLALLELLGEQPRGSTIKWLSAVSGIPISTCYHLINTLVEAGYVEKEKSTQLYRLSYKIAYLNQQIQDRRGFPQSFADRANELARTLRETIYIAEWDNGEVVVRYIAEGDQAVKVRSLYVGYRDHGLLHALGRAVLAYVTPEELTVYRESHAVERRTPYSKTDPSDIDEELLLTRQRQCAVDVEELEPGLCCLGVPIFRLDGTVWGSVAVSLPRHRYHPSDERLVDLIKAKSLTMSESLGYPADTWPGRKSVPFGPPAGF